MSWIDKVNTDLIITTGDGKQYRPQWTNANISVEFNTTEFDFPGIKGTLLKKFQPRGNRYNFEILFQGDDHLDVTEAFRKSANNKKPWVVTHPFYGRINVQPLNLNIDNSKFNVSEIRCNIVETILDTFPKATVDPSDKIKFDKDQADTTFAESFESEIPTPNTELIEEMTADVSEIYNIGRRSILDDIDAEAYLNLFNAANTAILNATADPLAAIRAIQAFATYPSQFINSVQNRVQSLIDQFDGLRSKVDSITGKSSKKAYEATGAALISSLVLASITDPEYDNRAQVIAVLDDIMDAATNFYTDLDSLQSETGTDVDSYIPDSSALVALSLLVNFCASNLINISLDSKQERSIVCEADTNLIVLAHRLYGLKDDDSTIESLIKTNDITRDELFLVPKGRKIVYYV